MPCYPNIMEKASPQISIASGCINNNMIDTSLCMYPYLYTIIKICRTNKLARLCVNVIEKDSIYYTRPFSDYYLDSYNGFRRNHSYKG